jgi:outer membrane cobalamin receptor
MLRTRERRSRQAGVGDALRLRATEWLWLKASYELATRLPSPDEIFGDGVLTVANLELEPETSHNLNLGATVDARETATGSWRVDLNAFVRRADQLIVLLGNDQTVSYQNVYGAQSLGVELAAGWTSPGEYLALDANVTYAGLRNTSRQGAFGDFRGDRIPNRPYLFANGSVRVNFRGAAVARDRLSFEWNTRYVHGFYRGWESVGLRSFKQTVDAQLLHSAALTYVVQGEHLTLGFTGEVQNLTDAAAFDFFGVQRPGRAFYFKTTAEF